MSSRPSGEISLETEICVKEEISQSLKRLLRNDNFGNTITSARDSSGSS